MLIGIDKAIEIACKRCGTFWEFDTLAERSAKCPGCSRSTMFPFSATWESLFKTLGISFALDWDEQLIVEFPDGISDEMLNRFESWLRVNQSAVRRSLKLKAELESRQLIGGPLNGVHESNAGGRYANWSQRLMCHIKRGEWAVYDKKDRNDPRWYFAGLASSEKAARNLKRETK